eukprot:2401016-Alexandrium_andersonii.AAC.1
MPAPLGAIRAVPAQAKHNIAAHRQDEHGRITQGIEGLSGTDLGKVAGICLLYTSDAADDM